MNLGLMPDDWERKGGRCLTTPPPSTGSFRPRTTSCSCRRTIKTRSTCITRSMESKSRKMQGVLGFPGLATGRKLATRLQLLDAKNSASLPEEVESEEL